MLVNNLTYRYNAGTPMESVALKDVNIQINKGEFIGLIGHTGSGKSTLVQHLNGLLKPVEGAVYFNGEDISDPDFDLKSLRFKVGLVFQYPEHQLFAETVFADVCYGPKNLGLTKSECELRAYDALRKVGFPDDLIFTSPFELSGGQKRRAAIAGVLAMKPEVLILDEPTAGLDPKGRDEILGQIKTLQKEENMTILLVSHSMEDVARYVDRLIVMDHGSVRFNGPTHEVFQNYAELEKIGLAAPQVTYLTAALINRGIALPGIATTVEEAREMLRAVTGVK